MTDVRIGSKIHRNIEELSQGKLEHLLQLSNIEIVNYKACIVNYTPQQMICYGTPFIERLENVRDTVAGLLKEVA